MMLEWTASRGKRFPAQRMLQGFKVANGSAATEAAINPQTPVRGAVWIRERPVVKDKVSRFPAS
jgi:hypothetical protein